MSEHQVVVIGAGPSGVSVAVSLLDCGVRPLLVDRADYVGSSWRGRYDRLKLNTGRPLSHLPNGPIPRALPSSRRATMSPSIFTGTRTRTASRCG
jgi:cation diffusion facilitator CzcD-associated flavoprotein CzcO